MLRAAAVVLALSSVAPAAQQQPRQEEGPATPRRAVRYFTRDWSFQDIDLQTWSRRLAALGLEIPFSMSGTISGRLEIRLPLGALGSFRAYRLSGSLGSKQLTVAGLRLDNATAQADYAEGWVRLESVRFQIVPPSGADDAAARPGQFQGQARMQLVPRGDLAAHLQLDEIPVASLAQLVPGLQGILRGRVSGTVDTNVPVVAVRDRQAWEVTGRVTAPQLTLWDAPAARLSGGRLSVRNRPARASSRLSGCSWTAWLSCSANGPASRFCRVRSTRSLPTGRTSMGGRRSTAN